MTQPWSEAFAQLTPGQRAAEARTWARHAARLREALSGFAVPTRYGVVMAAEPDALPAMRRSLAGAVERVWALHREATATRGGMRQAVAVEEEAGR